MKCGHTNYNMCLILCFWKMQLFTVGTIFIYLLWTLSSTALFSLFSIFFVKKMVTLTKSEAAKAGRIKLCLSPEPEYASLSGAADESCWPIKLWWKLCALTSSPDWLQDWLWNHGRIHARILLTHSLSGYVTSKTVTGFCTAPASCPLFTTLGIKSKFFTTLPRSLLREGPLSSPLRSFGPTQLLNMDWYSHWDWLSYLTAKFIVLKTLRWLQTSTKIWRNRLFLRTFSNMLISIWPLLRSWFFAFGKLRYIFVTNLIYLNVQYYRLFVLLLVCLLWPHM